jgi:hypothetical protein
VQYVYTHTVYINCFTIVIIITRRYSSRCRMHAAGVTQNKNTKSCTWYNVLRRHKYTAWQHCNWPYVRVQPGSLRVQTKVCIEKYNYT